MRVLLVRLEGPAMAFGDEIVDNIGRVRRFPGASNLTGLIANALGWRRGERAAHQRLQDRLDFAVRIDRPGTIVADFQTAALNAGDRGWTTRGVPEGRAGGSGSYAAPHIRFRDFVADAALVVALTLRDADEPPILDTVAAALAAPARPLFLGRKPCLPSAPLAGAVVEAESPLAALAAAPADPADGALDDMQLVAPDDLRLPMAFERRAIADERNWRSGVHGGERRIAIGRVRHLEAPR